MKRTPKQIQATNRNWALFDLGGMRSRIMRMSSQGVIPNVQADTLLIEIERAKRTVLKIKP